MELKFKNTDRQSEIGSKYFYHRPNSTFIHPQINVMDPLDLSNVYIANSSIPNAEDGVFAKRFVPLLCIQDKSLFDSSF